MSKAKTQTLDTGDKLIIWFMGWMALAAAADLSGEETSDLLTWGVAATAYLCLSVGFVLGSILGRD